ncbi:hypothetical protein LX81_03484 [Palleronia aestuarii]|uniref:Uncharacterized protein n=1 Tax=Palleronia aestuarii TaxID=568105 RepID=A0A2W7N348_9RHOB|nr:hypothetical protein LX81_03484 [Palleronia aestuarii]
MRCQVGPWPIHLRNGEGQSPPDSARAPETAVEVVGAISLVDLLLAGTDRRITCLGVKLNTSENLALSAES